MAAGIKTGFPILEATNHAGGICRYYQKNGYEFSTGGPHWIFGGGKGLDYIKSQVEIEEYPRNAGVYYNHTFPYPIQATSQRENLSKEGTLKRWLSDNFSLAECNLFFNPFNEKYTSGMYEEILQSESQKTPRKDEKPHVPCLYEPKNGLSELVDKMSSQCQIEYNHKVVKIDTKRKVIIIWNGEKFIKRNYDKLITTAPLDVTLDMCGRFEHDLPFTSVLVFNIGAEIAENTPKENYLYVPFCKSGFYRLGFYSNTKKERAPKGKVALSAELSLLPDVEFDPYEIGQRVVEELQNWRFIGKVDTLDPTYVRCAYTWVRTNEVQSHLDWLKERDIISIGRYGSWKFGGITNSIEEGFGVQV